MSLFYKSNHPKKLSIENITSRGIPFLLLDSYGESDSKKSDDGSGHGDAASAAPAAPRGNYQRYHDALDERIREREAARQRIIGQSPDL